MRPLVRMAICTDHDYQFFKPWSLRFAQSGSAKRRPADIAPMTFVQTLLSPIEPAVATCLRRRRSARSLASIRCAHRLRLACRATAERDRPIVVRALARAVLSRRVLLHRSTFADLAYCVIGLATLGGIIGWAVVSTSWISDGLAALLTRLLGPPPQPHAPDFALNGARTILLFLGYELGFFFDHTLKHRIPALWELHRAHHSAEVLTPLVNFRVHPLNSLILANNLALFIGVIGGAARYALGRNAASFTLFDQNVLMLLYIYLTAQLQHSEIWIPFTGISGGVFMSPARHQCTIPSIPRISIAISARASRSGIG